MTVTSVPDQPRPAKRSDIVVDSRLMPMVSQNCAQRATASAGELNERPRKTLNWDTPKQRLELLLRA